MTPRPQTRSTDDNERSRRPSRGGPGAGVGPVIGFVLLAGVAIGVAGWLNSAKTQAGNKGGADQSASQGAAEPAPDPFAGLHEEPPAARGSKVSTTMRTTDKAPEGLTSTQVWVDALALGAEADVHAERARNAKEAGQYAVFDEEGKAAKLGFEKAFELTIAWEVEIIDSFGELDRQVRGVIRKRNEWRDQMMAFHKTTSK